MSAQHDFVGGIADLPPVPLKDIRNQRPSVAQEKAERLLILGGLLRKVPPCIAGWSVQAVRQWKARHASATKVAGNARSSVGEINSAINTMRSYFDALL